MSDSNLSYRDSPNPQDNLCGPCQYGSVSLIESKSSGIPIKHKVKPHKLSLKNAELILKKPSTFTKDNLYNHLVEIIKRIIDERPVNVIDYFEQFSRDVRKHKDRLSETAYETSYTNPEFLAVAVAILKSLRLILPEEEVFCTEEGFEDSITSPTTLFLSSVSSMTNMHRTLSRSENVIQLQHYWSFCGLGFQIDEVFQLSCAIHKIQNHHSIRSARFWGRMYGTDASYYIVEAETTKSERLLRMEHLERKLVKKMIAFIKRKMVAAEMSQIDTELIPGYCWQDYPQDELERMQRKVAPVPTFVVEEMFEIPPEPFGTGLNRKTYFVTTMLSEEWKELPIVTPKQIVASKKIRKFFTGDLEAKLFNYPTFPGIEKHYLRAMIARITAGSYIAPNSYFRKMTKKERIAMDREGELYACDEEEEEEEEVEDELAEDIIDNDCPIIEDENYKPYPVAELKRPGVWVHYRPHILKQGTVVYIDEEATIKNLVKVALKRIKEIEMGLLGEGQEGPGSVDNEQEPELDSENDGEEEFGEEEDFRPEPDTGPELFACAEDDRNSEYVEPWSSRSSEKCNSVNQTIMMRSNLWPGAYSFIHDKCCDSIYLGWGAKFVARMGFMEHLPDIQNFVCSDNVLEATDPTVEMEEKWRLYHMKKDFFDGGEMSISIETDIDDEEV